MMSLEWALGSELLQRQAAALRAEEERRSLRQTVAELNGDIDRIARHLGIAPDELSDRLEQLGLRARIVIDDEEISDCIRL